MNKTKYFFDRDDSWHWYLIDAKFRQEWYLWLKIGKDPIPEYASMLGHGITKIEFENPTIDGIGVEKEELDDLLTGQQFNAWFQGRTEL